VDSTPAPRYVAVIFTSQRTDAGEREYDETAAAMEELAATQLGYLGIESARDPDGFGITISYWATAAAALAWKRVAEHRVAQQRGRDEWYASYRVRVADVTRDYSHP
jgi:heme-degrading monooxygenase HmoA